MLKKYIIQIILFLIVILALTITFKIYYQKDVVITSEEKKNEIPKKVTIDKEKEGADSSNIIENLKYIYIDNQDNEYEIRSEYGNLDRNNEDEITMQNVIAVIRSEKFADIKIVADYALYNNKNYESNFYGNVILTHVDHKMISDNLDLSFEKNLLKAYNNLVYNNITTKLIADRLEINLITKNSKIFMNDTSKKINIYTNK
jgi:hypothetical protein